MLRRASTREAVPCIMSRFPLGHGRTYVSAACLHLPTKCHLSATHTRQSPKKLAVPHVCAVGSAHLAESVLREGSGHDNTYLWFLTSHLLGFRICFCAYAGIRVCLRLWEFTAL